MMIEKYGGVATPLFLGLYRKVTAINNSERKPWNASEKSLN